MNPFHLTPLRTALAGYDRDRLRADLVAGLTTAVMLVPQGMGYAALAGLPPVVGLYASVTPLLVYALLGTSRTLSVGPVAMDSMLVAVTVSVLAQSGSEQYLTLTLQLALMVGALQLVLGLLGMGYLANFLSRPVLSGFTSAAALIIAASQLTHLLQVTLPTTHHVHRVAIEAVMQIADWHWPTLIVGGSSIALLVGLKRYRGRWPRGLLVVVLSTLAVVGLDLHARGVAIVGEVPAGLPPLRLGPWSWESAVTMLPGAATIALLSFVEAISAGRHFARVDGSALLPSRELVALGAANLVGGVFGGYPIAGGLSRSAVHSQAGARTQVAGAFTAMFVLLTLLVLTPLFYSLPKAVLAAIVITAVAGLFDTVEPRRLWRIKRTDLYLLLATFGLTLVLGIQWGILWGVGLSLSLFVVRTTRPHFALVGRIPDTEAYLNIDRHPHAIRTPGVLVVRIDAQLYFGNVTFLKDTLQTLVAHATTPLRAIVLDAGGMNELDSSAEAALRELDDEFGARGIRILYAHVKGPVRDVMHRSGLLERLSREGRVFLRTHDAVLVGSGQRTLSTESRPDEDDRAPADRIGCGKLVDGREG